MSRRGFLRTATAAAAGAPWISVLGAEKAEIPRGLRGPQARSQVVRIRDGHVVTGVQVHRPLFGEMLDRALQALTGQASTAKAWRTLLKHDDVIGLKFNRVGQDVIGTSDATAGAIVGSLVAAGWPAERIVCIEAPPQTTQRLATTTPTGGFRDEVTSFGSGEDQFASVLDQVTAIIDVPFLKTHNIAVMSGALKNLSHAFVRHPARFHRNGCSPFVADIVRQPIIRAKLRLCIVDALRVVYEGGPDPRSDGVSDEGMLLLSADPVATDTVGLSELNTIRRDHGLAVLLPPNRVPPFLADAHHAGLGTALWHEIEVADLAAE